MKKILLISTAILIATLPMMTLNAQNERGQRNGDRTEQRKRVGFAERQANLLKTLTTELSLSQAQVTKISALNKQYDETFTKLRGEASSPEDRQALRTKMRTLMDKYNTELKSTLNDEQKEKYEAILKEKQSSREGNRSGNRSGSRGGSERGQGNRGNR